MNCILRYCLLLISFFVLQQLPAQPVNCIDFTSPPVGTTFSADTGVEPGDVVHEYPGIDLIMDTYSGANGDEFFGNISISDFTIDQLETPFAIINFANATFQFDGAANNLCFTSWISGEIINFGINGEIIQAENLLDPIIPELWPDYQFAIEVTGTTPGSIVYMCISGPLESFTIGGVEQIIDDVCVDYYPTCTFTNPVIEPICQNDGAIDINIDFEEIIGDNEFVDVIIDGDFFAFYPIEAFPITLEGLFPNGGPETTSIQVCINDNPNCCYEVTVALPNCFEDNCIAFENMGADTIFTAPDYQPGDVIFEFPGVDLIMDTYVSIDGSLEFGELTVTTGPNGVVLPESPFLYSFFANATFAYASPVTEVCMLVSFNDEQVNLGINGEIVPATNLLNPELPGAFDNHNVLFTPLDPDNGLYQLCISGYIESVTIGGVGMIIDDVCSSVITCSLSNLQAAQYACEDDNLPYLFYLNFEHNQMAQDSFDLFVGGSGNLFGRYAYGDLPLSELEFGVEGGTGIDLTVVDAENPDCFAETSIEVHFCAFACADFLATPGEVLCVETAAFSAQLVLSTPPAGQSIFLYGLSTGDLVDISPYNEWDGVNFIIDNAFDPEGYRVVDQLTGCETTFPAWEFDPEVCQECFLTAVSVLPTPCNADGSYSIEIDLESSNPFDPLYVIVDDDQVFGPFEPAEFPVALGGFFGSADVVTVTIQSSTGNCLSTTELVQNCNFNCEDFGVEILEVNCFLTDSIQVVMNIHGVALGSQMFLDTEANLDFSGEFVFTGNPFMFAYSAQNTGNVTAFALFNLNNDCELFFELQTPENCLPQCENFTAELTDLVCISDSPYVALEITLDGVPENSNSFYIQNQSTGTLLNVEFTENPLFVSWPTADEGELLIYDLINGCQSTIVYENTEDCEVDCSNVFDIMEVGCDNVGNPVFVFTADGPAGLPFFVRVGGPNSPEYPFVYGEDTYTLTVDPTPGAFTYELRFRDQQAGCVSEILVDNPCFCFVDILSAEPTECDDNGQYNVIVTATGATSWGSGEFVLQVGNQIQSFGGGTVTYEFGPFDSGLVSVFLTEVNTELCQAQELVFQQCPTPDCELFDLVIEGTECDAEGNYFLEITFDSNVNGPFSVYNVNTNDSVSVSLNDLPVVFGPYNIEEIESHGIVVHGVDENNQPTCIIDESFFQECEPIFCEIDDLFIQGSDCDEDGNYFLNVTFNSNVDGPFTLINEATGDVILTGLNDLPVTFGPYNFSEIQTSLIIVTAEQNNGNGCLAEEIFVQECETICPLQGVFVNASDCDEDGNYTLTVEIESTEDGLYSVLLLGTDDEFEGLTLDSFPYVFGPYNADEQPFGGVSVSYISSNLICVETGFFETECETEECNFSNIFAEAYACDGDQFLVDVQFDNPNGGPLGFYIFGDGMLFGPYQYGENFYTFGPLDGNESEHDILLLDIANPACFGTYDFSYSCSDDCIILEVIATPTECDGEFFNVELDVTGNNLGETFSVVGNGNNYGTFNYSDLPITLGPFLGDAETSYEFGVIDLENAGCTNFTEIEPVNCQPCDIRDLVYEVDCNEDGYQLTLDFIFENQESDLFAVLIGGEVYEFFSYGELPLTIAVPYSFTGNTLRVEDILNELCGETVDLFIPCCTLGNALDAITVNECEENGEYSFTVGEISGGNLSDSLVINYSPAGSSIIATEVVAYNTLPATFGPLNGDGTTSYIVILSDQLNECAVTTTISPVFCDNDACVEFEGVEGVFAPIFGYDTGDEITTENEVVITYQRNPLTNCACNLFVTDGIPGEDFGSGHIVATQNSGFGLDFTGVSTTFNTVNIDYYYTGGTIGLTLNEVTTVSETGITDLPTAISPGVELQVVPDPDNPNLGMLTFSGDNIEQLILFTNENAGFDNVCLSLDDNVWPGDTNSDNIANHIDLLSIGLTFGNTGPARTAPTSEWAGLISQNWGATFADGTNHKHADANGDGMVDLLDLQVLEQNYNLVHGPVTDFEPLPSTELDPPVFVDLPDQLPVGTVLEIPIIAGAADQVINDVYGLAFTLELDPEIFNMSSVAIVYPTSWFGEPGINTATIHEVYPDGRIEVALTRTDHNNVSGFGPIMALRIIIDDIAGLEVPTGVVVKNLLGIDHEEQPLVLRPGTSSTIVTKTDEGFDRDLLRATFSIFPNPTRNGVNFHNHYNMSPMRVDIFNAAGQHLRSVRQPGMQLDVSSLPAGVYMLQVHLEGHIFTERLVKLD